jgi:hypothetical protein
LGWDYIGFVLLGLVPGLRLSGLDWLAGAVWLWRLDGRSFDFLVFEVGMIFGNTDLEKQRYFQGLVEMEEKRRRRNLERDSFAGIRMAALCARLGFLADAGQKLVLESDSKRVILNCTRQWGKSSVTALKALHTALRAPKALVVAMSPSERQSGEFLLKVRDYLVALGMGGLRGDGVNKLSVVLPNGSRVVALPGVEATMRGYSAVDLLIVEEASRVKDAQYESAGPMLAVKDGALWLISTPYGARGFFWREWELGGEGWLRLRVTAPECSRIPAAFLSKEQTRISADWYRQEYLCEFLGNENGPFHKELLERAFDEGLEDLF